MAASDRSTAQQNSDSQGGYRSLAGYVYQLLGSVAEAVELIRLDSNACAIEGLITLEQFGQDSFVALVPGTNESRLTQYKHSTSEKEIEPSELLIILERFVSATTLGGLSIAKCQYQLRTNRKAHSLTDELLNKQKTYKQDPTTKNEHELLSELWKGEAAGTPINAKAASIASKKSTTKSTVAVGTAIAGCPPHISVREGLPHTTLIASRARYRSTVKGCWTRGREAGTRARCDACATRAMLRSLSDFDDVAGDANTWLPR